MSIKGKAYIAGIYEHPTRLATDISLAQIHAQVAKGALDDAGLTKDDVDGYFCAGDAPGLGPMSMVEYMGLKPRHVEFDRHRRLVLPAARRPRRRGDRDGQVQGGADHPGRPAARRRHGDRHRAAQPRRHADAGRARSSSRTGRRW